MSGRHLILHTADDYVSVCEFLDGMEENVRIGDGMLVGLCPDEWTGITRAPHFNGPESAQ